MNGEKRRFVVCDDAEGVARAGAELFVSTMGEAIRERGRASVALSGGSTPRRMYELLASEPWASKVDWGRVHFFWGDERCVPPQDRASNYRMACEAMLTALPVPKENIHRIPGEASPPERAAEEYESEMRKFFDGPLPTFDLILLGLGTNAHTASLFPNSNALREQSRWVVADFIEEINACRITLTVPVLNNARDVAFLVCGAEKAEVVRDVVAGKVDPQRKPAQLIRPVNGNQTWVLDRAAAGKL